MKSAAIVVAIASVLSAAPGHPPVAPLPPGHPSVVPGRPDAAPADPADVGSIEAVVAAYYASVSGPPGAPRAWDRFRSLFLPGARLVRAGTGAEAAGTAPITLTPEQFVEANRRYFERGGYFEKEVHRRVDAFGHIAHVFSTYEARRAAGDEKPYSRGINSFQLVSSGGRWWIVTIMWDHERAHGATIPPRYLPPGPGSGG
jgi:hypothetical protein